MNRRVNVALFVVAATIVNVLLMTLIFGAGIIGFGRFLAPHLPPGVNSAMFLVLFVASVVLTYVVYHRIVRLLTDRYNLQDYLAATPGSSRRRIPDGDRNGDA